MPSLVRWVVDLLELPVASLTCVCAALELALTSRLGLRDGFGRVVGGER